MVKAFISRLWSQPLAKGINVDDPTMITVHQKIIESNPILIDLYEKRYRALWPSVEATKHLELPMIEIGAGPSFIQKHIPDVIKTDVVSHPNVDQVLDATQLPHTRNGLRAIFGMNVLHHLPQPKLLLAEAERCLAPGGRLTLIEPSNSPIQKFITNRFSQNEYCDDSVSDWNNQVKGRLSHANNSLPWIIFIRDRKKFESCFPQLRIKDIRFHIFLGFYLSGGFSYQPFIPRWMFPLVKGFEWLTQPLCSWQGFEMIVEVEKTKRVDPN